MLREFEGQLDVTMLRVPTIIEGGRLGLLAILFEFIHENKTVSVVGDGGSRYQFIYAEDLADACLLALKAEGVNLFPPGFAVEAIAGNAQRCRHLLGTGSTISSAKKMRQGALAREVAPLLVQISRSAMDGS